MSFLVDDDEEYELDEEEESELTPTINMLRERICDLEDNFTELRKAVRDSLEAIQQAEDELEEILNNFTPE